MSYPLIVTGGTATSDYTPHVCNCIGCCPRCGTCRTWPGHTPEWCALLVQQAAERNRLFVGEGQP